MSTLSPAANPGRHALRERGEDLYETPPEATLALLCAERLPHHLWEPAAGRGAIVKVLRAAGHAVIASDIVDYGFPTHFNGRDFLMEHRLPANVEAIVTNPPFKIADQFVSHALDLCPHVCMLLRLVFLESARRARIRLRMVCLGPWASRTGNDQPHHLGGSAMTRARSEMRTKAGRRWLRIPRYAHVEIVDHEAPAS